MADKKQVEQQYYSRPPKLGKWEGFKQFLWNSETSQFLGRTGSSWGKFSHFFVIFGEANPVITKLWCSIYPENRSHTCVSYTHTRKSVRNTHNG